MARYSEDRGTNRDIKYLYKTWSKVDSRIELPSNLKGEALLSLIEDIPAPRPKQPHRQIQFSPRVFSWKSGVTYAAALVLIVALSAMVGRIGSNSDLESGVIEPTSQPEVSPGFERPDFPDLPDETGEPTVPANTDGVTPDTSSPAGSESMASQPDDAESENPLEWYGGPQSTKFAEDAQYAYYWRDSGGTVTIDVAKLEQQEETVTSPEYSFSVLSLRSVSHHFLYGDILAVAGPALDGSSIALEIYSLAEPGKETHLQSVAQQGTLLDARLYKNIINLVTYTELEPACEIEQLPHAVNESYCVISAVDLDTQQSETVAFRGADNDVALYNLNAYIQYTGEVTEANDQGSYTAHVRLDGIHIALRTDTAEDE